MRRTLLVLCLAFALPTAALAADAPRTISMTGQGFVTAPPDQAVISGGAVTQGATAAEAMEGNSAIMNRVMAALDRLGIPKSAIVTSNFTLDPRYSNTAGPHTITGYDVSNQISVTVDDVGRAGSILDALIAAGANDSARVRFGIKNRKPLIAAARAKASADAIERAEAYAKSIGVTLGRVRSIHEGNGYGYSLPSTVEDGDSAPTPIQAAAQSVSASVSVEWELK